MISWRKQFQKLLNLLSGDEEVPIMYLHAMMAIVGSVTVLLIVELKEVPMTNLQHSLLALVEKTCVIVVIAYVISRLKFFTDVLEGTFTIKNQVILILIFGGLSIFGTYSGVEIFGAMANVRDLGPMVAGLIGGPIMGLGAGLIGGLYRLTLGGFTAVPCAISTILAGLLAGLIFLINKRKFVGVFWAVVFAILMEGTHMLINLAMARPYEQAVVVVSDLTIPMIFSNALGMLIFAFLISNILKEQKTIRQRDRYFDELERKKHELKVANKIQKSFFPDELPILPNFGLATLTIPSHESDGSFYDFIETAPHKMGIVIADVVGESFPASLLMALSRTIIRGESKQKDPASLIQYLNNLIAVDIGPDISITLLYGELDLVEHRFTYVNAAHKPPLIYRAKNQKVEKLASENKNLGRFEHIQLQTNEITIFNKDVLLFYSYGIIQALESPEIPGEKKLRQLFQEHSSLPPKEIIEKIKDQAILTDQNSDDLVMAILKADY
jgi:sigma-B regulation protein RsbU (phosphoserine phosphatase)